jgi:7,8-dihydropterin-6-yl-methyl-4-(beta-D-ribofuranosyl)aminobenzene 5'-phosphate synthase
MIKIITVYDNIECNPRFKLDWGFGCIIDHPEARILFDTGAKAEILEANLKEASIAPESIDMIIMSHKHWDHKGGALWLTHKNPRVKIYMPKSWTKRLERELIQSKNNINIVKNNLSITKNFHLVVSKNFWIRELVFVISTSHGALVLTGCSHTGIDYIAQKVKNVTGLSILALFGGFHLFRASTSSVHKITNVLKKTQVKSIAPCHCTGEKATKMLQKAFAKNFLLNGVGAEFIFEE